MEQPSDVKVTVRFELKSADALWANIWWLSRRWSIVVIYVFFTAALFAGLAFGISRGWRYVSPLHITSFAVILILIPSIVYLQVMLIFRQLKPEQLQKCYGFSEQGFTVADGLSHAEISWKAVHRVVETKRAFHLFMLKQMFHVIPRRAFSNSELLETRILLKNVLGASTRLRTDMTNRSSRGWMPN